MNSALSRWRSRQAAGADLALFQGEEMSLVLDTRLEEPHLFILDRLAADLLVRCDGICGLNSLTDVVPETGEHRALVSEHLLQKAADVLIGLGVRFTRIRSNPDVKQLLDELTSRGLLVAEGQGYLSLTIPRAARILADLLGRVETPVVAGSSFER
jgi:hypothetical protein